MNSIYDNVRFGNKIILRRYPIMEKEIKKMCEGSFQSIDKEVLTPDSLMEVLEEEKVVLIVRSYEGNTCEVRSLAMIDGEVILYCPIHSLFKENEELDDGWEQITTTNLEDWRDEFAKDETLVDLDNEFHVCLGDDKARVYEFVTGAIDVCVSDEYDDFAGMLEIEFIEEWLRLNKKYYLCS